MAWYSVGLSSYPDLKGQEQFVNSARIAAQFLSMCRDYAAKFGGNGDRLSANEARRTRPRQQELYANYLRTGYPVAAYPYTSRHDEYTHGNAIDVGVTMKNGVNRALTAAEFAWMHTAAETRGFTWTGKNFVTPEPWHIEGATRVEVYPPYDGINVDNAATGATTSKPATTTTPVGDVMNTEIIPIDNKGTADMYLVNAETMKCLHLTSSTQVKFWKNRGVKQYVTGNQPKSVLTGFELVAGKGAN